MNISQTTIEALGNLSLINPSIFIPSGNVLRAMDLSGTIGARFHIEESFDHDVAIYDLPNFLQILKLFPAPNLNSNEKQAIINFENGMKVKYLFASKNAIHKIITSDPKFPAHQLEFELPDEIIKYVVKSAGALSASNLVLTKGESGVDLTVTNVDNTSSNISVISLPVIKDDLPEYSIVFHIENIAKIMSGDYIVKISDKMLSEFVNVDGKSVYWLALGNQTVIG